VGGGRLQGGHEAAGHQLPQQLLPHAVQHGHGGGGEEAVGAEAAVRAALEGGGERGRGCLHAGVVLEERRVGR
jgi:hypothetical protein